MRKRQPHVVVFIDENQNLDHTGYVHLGLIDLARRGDISLELKVPSTGSWREARPGNAFVVAELSAERGAPGEAICFDLHDQSNWFYSAPLEQSTWYFKRSYHRPDVDALAPDSRRKVAPFTPCFRCGATRSARSLGLALGTHMLRSRASIGEVVGRLRGLSPKVLEHARMPDPRWLRHPPTEPKDIAVVYQPRLWEAAQVPAENCDVINQQRIDTLLALRHNFPGRFVGGLVPTPLARARFSSLISAVKSTAYLSMTKRSLVGVYTRGLHHSTAWKLGEYFAVSMGVVAEPIRNEAREPLLAGVHYVPFSSPAECVEACGRMLDDRAHADQVRAAAYDYYRGHIDPAEQLAGCLRLAGAEPRTDLAA